MFEFSGTIKVIQPTQEISDRFRKREFVVEENSGQYPQVIPFEFTQDKCEVLDTYKVGDEVKVSFNLRGREWVSKQNETKYFLSLQAWKIESLAGGGQSSQPAEYSSAPPNNGTPPPPSASDAPAEDDDDLPF